MLAYALALQALLGAWVGQAAAASSASLDPAAALCRTLAGDDTPQSGDEHAPAAHCALMCLTGVCAAGDPPATLAMSIDFPAGGIVLGSMPDIGRLLATLAPGGGLNARGPPQIA
ncbi:hypothetical protein [Bradyrhizobium sp. LHD-71]|uniref:hypothetical protein n=1 Tax=Bradyrhizobium sp. LHD-71 TaxID=3072141 RepID=UPI00280E42D7|nr:hypothetical protein [Bradyrhizobium sp. LHD-71]MDQ8728833.1 hypothetical protein [Bradyrhizobium sp. LHD-71]